MAVTARAHPNIALLKYWGKQTRAGNLPAVPSLSITLDSLHTTTTVDASQRDAVILNDELVEDAKIGTALSLWRQTLAIPPLKIISTNNFPTAAGLASSASGFAALITALNIWADLGLSEAQRSDLARQASGSAARSIFGGYVELSGPDWLAVPVAPREHWPLNVVIAITSESRKATSSSSGMRLSQRTSAFFDAWTRTTAEGLAPMREAIMQRDFAALAEQAEASCLMMHAVMLSSRPGLMYWNPSTLACLHQVRDLRSSGVPVFFTVDAGPQVKAICQPQAVPDVVAALNTVPGVLRTVTCGLGGDATRIDPELTDR